MQIKVRVKLNDNENVEEWWPPSLILDGLANDLLDLISLQAKTIELLTEWNTRQQARIERLEQILARNGTAEAIELRSQLISEVNGRYVSEEPEPNGARPGEVCPHCGLPARAHTVEYEDSGPVAVCPGPGGARFREAEGSPIDKWDTYKPRQVVT